MSEIAQKERNESTVAERTRGEASYTPRADIIETADELLLFADMPGVSPETIDIRYENRELTIYGRVPDREPNAGLVYREYGVGDFYRAFTIAEALNPEKIHAELKQGVLIVHLPKSEAIKPRRIEVKAK